MERGVMGIKNRKSIYLEIRGKGRPEIGLNKTSFYVLATKWINQKFTFPSPFHLQSLEKKRDFNPHCPSWRLIGISLRVMGIIINLYNKVHQT